MKLREALDRTLLLMRDEVLPAVSDETLLAALTETTVALVADARNLKSHSAQSAFVTAALLLARSGHKVHLIAPDVTLIEYQPPLSPGRLMRQLMSIGRRLLPGISFSTGLPANPVDIAVLLGDSQWAGVAWRTVRLNATSWQARLLPAAKCQEWEAGNWPIGGLGAAALAASECFKTAMRRIRGQARSPEWFDELFAPTPEATIDLAPPGTPEINAFGKFDCISGGAIINDTLYALLRIPAATGVARVLEFDKASLSNLNRCMLFLRSHRRILKAEVLATFATPELSIEAVNTQFDGRSHNSLGPFADSLLVGVDHIPTRWATQKMWPRWLGIGATTHFSAMASFHTPELPCAGCLHNRDDPDHAPIPTAAFVSFWAGLLLAVMFLRHRADALRIPANDQQVFFSPLRPESAWWSAVRRLSDCPVGCGNRVARRRRTTRRKLTKAA